MRNTTKRHFITVTGLTESEHLKVKAEAKKERLTVSAYCLRKILDIVTK